MKNLSKLINSNILPTHFITADGTPYRISLDFWFSAKDAESRTLNVINETTGELREVSVSYYMYQHNAKHKDVNSIAAESITLSTMLEVAYQVVLDMTA